MLELILGYNGFGRLTGDETGSVVAGGGQGGSMWGETGWGRLLSASYGGQVAWLLPAALAMIVVLLVTSRRGGRTDLTRAAVLGWGGWLVVTAAVISFSAGIIHEYYTVALAPAIGALVGIGSVDALGPPGARVGAAGPGGPHRRDRLVVDGPAGPVHRVRDLAGPGGAGGWAGRCCRDRAGPVPATSGRTQGRCSVPRSSAWWSCWPVRRPTPGDGVEHGVRLTALGRPRGRREPRGPGGAGGPGMRGQGLPPGLAGGVPGAGPGQAPPGLSTQGGAAGGFPTPPGGTAQGGTPGGIPGATGTAPGGANGGGGAADSSTAAPPVRP